MIKIMLVDDHLLFRKGLCALLEQRTDMCVVAEAGNGQEAMREYGLKHPDVILMDVSLPGVDGIQLTRNLIASDPDAKIIMLSATDFDDQVIDSIQAGALGYLAKSLEPEELFETIETVSTGNVCLSRERLAQIMTSDGHRSFVGDQARKQSVHDGLSERESQVLSLIAEGKTNKEIASELFIAVNTVKAHISNIMSKLGLHSRVELAAYCMKGPMRS